MDINETYDGNPKEFKEPVVTYQKSNIRFFTSFEDMNEADYAEMADLDGIEHLKNATALIKRLYKDELKKKPIYKLHFRR